MSSVLRPLDVERAVPALLSALDTAGLDTPELPKILRKGTCGVLAEAAVPIGRLYRFDEGGVNPQGQRVARPGYTVSEVRRNSGALARALENEKVLQTYYVHEPLKRPDEVQKSDGPSLVVGGQLLYVRDATLLTADDLASLVSKNSLSWHFLMFCTASPARSYQRMADLLSDSICLVSGVYDGESYLVWTGVIPK
jgi:hypothetical protein